MRLDLEKVQANVARAETEDLLDRATVYRAGMEPEALALIDAELEARGITAEEIANHAQARQLTSLMGPDGLPVKCWRCHRPAVGAGWSWHRLWGLLPVFPRWLAFCGKHLPGELRHLPEESSTESEP
jgi:hypothetical protein